MVRFSFSLVFCALFSSTQIVSAQQVTDGKFELWLGLFRTDQDTTIRVDSDYGLGTEIDLEEDLGLDETLTNVLRAGFNWRFFPRHLFTVEYYYFRRDGSVSSQRDFEWEDISGAAGAQVDTTLNIDILESYYAYALVKKPKHELRGNFGLFWMNIDTELTARGDGNISVGGEPLVGEISATGSARALAPLPVLGLEYDWRLTPAWQLMASIDWFGIGIENISGSLINWDIGFRYQTPWHLNVGLNYTSFAFDLEIDADDWRGELEWKFRGPQLYLGASF